MSDKCLTMTRATGVRPVVACDNERSVIGARIGDYEIEAAVASGGMASVFRAKTVGTGLDRTVALKLMHQHLSQDPDFVAMFLDEARFAAAIRHPNVVQTLDILQTPSGLCMVMEFVDGASLNAIIARARKRKQAISVPLALRIAMDALSGLHAAHELKGPHGDRLNLVHRDISPHNILVGKDGLSRVTDFGIAQAEHRLAATRDSSIKGKAPYMAPEQLRGEKADRRTDIYAVAAVLWEMLAGERLFPQRGEAAVLTAVLQGPRSAPRAVNPSIPPAVDAVVMNALGPRDLRFATSADFAKALVQAAFGSGLEVAGYEEIGELAAKVGHPVSLPPKPLSALADESRATVVSLLHEPGTQVHTEAMTATTTGTETGLTSDSGPKVATLARAPIPRAVLAGAAAAGAALLLVLLMVAAYSLRPAPPVPRLKSVGQGAVSLVRASAASRIHSVSPSGAPTADPAAPVPSSSPHPPSHAPALAGKPPRSGTPPPAAKKPPSAPGPIYHPSKL